jgi:hypothetical protein
MDDFRALSTADYDRRAGGEAVGHVDRAPGRPEGATVDVSRII